MDLGTLRSPPRALLVVVIAAMTLLIAALDFVTSAEIIGSILFTLPLALCALHDSRRVLMLTTTAAVIFTFSADFWGIGRTSLDQPQSAMINRALLVVALLTLGWFIDRRTKLRKQLVSDRETIAAQRVSLAAGSAQLEQLAMNATSQLAERLVAAEHLVQVERRYRSLLEAAPDPILVVSPDGTIVLANLQAKHQFGYERGELIGNNVTAVIPHGFAERISALAARPEVATGIELLGLRKDGTTFPIEITSNPLESDDGVLVTAAIRDISVRKAQLAHLAEMEAKYRGLLEASPDAMLLLDASGVVLLVSLEAERQFGYGRDELLGQPIAKILPDGVADRLIGDAIRSAKPGSSEPTHAVTELAGRRRNGTTFPIEAMAAPLQREHDLLVTVAIRDITTRVEIEERLQRTRNELERSNEELEQFAAIASHDLQEPLRMVASFTQLLAKRYRGQLDADADEFIGYAVDGADRMQRLIQDLLAYSRIGTRGKELDTTSSATALARALENLSTATESSGAVITHDPLPMVLADERQLTQLFQNLLGNALKYQRADVVPKIHIAIAADGNGRQQFSVSDNGIGVDAKYFGKIFGMFQRLHKRTEYTGTGIGLAICKKIVERHGGQISVESIVGSGSTFHFGLTAAKESYGCSPRQ